MVGLLVVATFHFLSFFVFYVFTFSASSVTFCILHLGIFIGYIH